MAEGLYEKEFIAGNASPGTGRNKRGKRILKILCAWCRKQKPGAVYFAKEKIKPGKKWD